MLVLCTYKIYTFNVREIEKKNPEINFYGAAEIGENSANQTETNEV